MPKSPLPPQTRHNLPNTAQPQGGIGGGSGGMTARPGDGLASSAAAAALPPLSALAYSDAAATAAADALLAESMRRGTMDNVTVIVMLLQWG